MVLVISCSQHKWPASSDVDAADHDGDHGEDDDDQEEDDEDDDEDSHPKEGSETPRALEGQVFSTLFSIAACITIIGHDQNGGEHVWRFDDVGRMSLACFFGGIFEFLRRKWQRSRSLIRPEASLDFLIWFIL